LFHDPGNTILAAGHIVLLKFPINARSTINLPALGMDNPDMIGQFAVLLASTAFRALEPGIISTAGDIEYLAH
jgi:hypothetical protein